jgi:hypothetical protein
MSGATEEDDVLLASPSGSCDGPTRAEPRDGAASASPGAGPPVTPSRYPARVTPADVLALTAPTETFLCPLSANVYDFDFLEFEIKDYDTGESVFKIAKNPDSALPNDPFGSAEATEALFATNPSLEAAVRTVRYTFPRATLRCRRIRTALTFSVGERPARDFRLIERHYFRDALLRSYDFTFGFCIPNSVNGWEAIYPAPDAMTAELEKQMVDNPFETRSDSFYFVEGTLVMHNKAVYEYVDDSERGEGVR